MTEGPLYKYRYQPVAEVIDPPRRVPTTQNIAPALIAQTDTLFSPVTTRVANSTYSSASAFYRRRRIPSSEVIYTFRVPNVGIVTPLKFTESDTYFAPAITTSKTILAQNSFNDADGFFGPAIGLVVPAAKFTDSDTIFIPLLGGGFTAVKFTDSDAFFAPLIGPRPGLFIDTDTVFAPSLVGGVSTGPAKIVDSDAFFGPIVLTLKQVAPTFFLDSDVIFVPGLAATRSLTPSLLVDSDSFASIAVIYNLGAFFFGDSDSFFNPTLVGGVVGAAPGRINDSDLFWAPSIINAGATSHITTYSAASAWVDVRRFIPPMSVTIVIARPVAGDVGPNKLMDIDTIFSPGIGGGQFMVHPGIYVESDTHYIPTVNGGILKRNYNEVDSSTIVKNPRWLPPPMSVTVVIRGPAQGTLVTPSLFADNDTFFSPTLGVGAVNITPTLFIDPDSPRMALVTGGGAQPTMAGRINDADQLFAPALAVGTVNVAPAKFTDADLFFNPVTILFVGPSKFTDTDAVFNPIVQAVSDIQPALFVDSNVFFAPVLSVGPVNLTPFKFIDTDVLMMPSVGSKIDVGFFTDTSTFYSPTVTQRNDITPNLIADADRVFRPQLVYNQTIAASSIIDVDTLFEPFFPSDPKYTYPVGHGMQSDYSIRRPRQGRVIIGRH